MSIKDRNKRQLYSVRLHLSYQIQQSPSTLEKVVENFSLIHKILHISQNDKNGLIFSLTTTGIVIYVPYIFTSFQSEMIAKSTLSII